MTYTEPQINPNQSVVPSEDALTQALRMQAAAHFQIAEDVARLKAMGEAIYYSIGKKLVREEADGRKFEYRRLADGSEEILGEMAKATST